jgi:hypothetical protein
MEDAIFAEIGVEAHALSRAAPSGHPGSVLETTLDSRSVTKMSGNDAFCHPDRAF